MLGHCDQPNKATPTLALVFKVTYMEIPLPGKTAKGLALTMFSTSDRDRKPLPVVLATTWTLKNTNG
jgi:hypothetical protein